MGCLVLADSCMPEAMHEEGRRSSKKQDAPSLAAPGRILVAFAQRHGVAMVFCRARSAMRAIAY